jgi:ubiquinone/menaquinone biosynthesis C-methylase UbiE
MDERRKLKILELGCGSGANLWMVAKEDYDAYGMDSSPTGLEFCKLMLERWGVNAKLELGDFTDLKYSDNYFDVIFDVVSLQHINFSQHVDAFKSIFRCLKPKGKFFSYHLGENSISLKSNDDLIDHCTVRSISPGYPLTTKSQTCFMSANETRKLLSDIGFKSINVEKIVRSYENQKMYIEYLIITAEKE